MADISFKSSTPKIIAKSSHLSNERMERKTLQTLQPSAELSRNIDSHNSGYRYSVSKYKKSVSCDNRNHSSSLTRNIALSIYQDASTDIDSHGIHCTRSCQTDNTLLDALLEERQLRQMNASTDSGHQSGYLDPEAYELMGNEMISDSYWKDVAEERRIALKKTLEENELLCEEIDQLKGENGRLADLALKAEELQNLLNTVLSEDETETETNADADQLNLEDIDSSNTSGSKQDS